LNHLNLLEYNYIVFPPPSEFCECICSCGRCARIPHTRLGVTLIDSVFIEKLGRQSYGITLCGNINNTNIHMRGKCCSDESMTIHKGASRSTTIHKVASNGKNTTKSDGDGEA
jgi:hypothetical protein